MDEKGSDLFDLLIKNGLIVDGAGRPAYEADLGVKGTKIAAIGDLGRQIASQIIDASGLVVAPGFIDMHSHADYSLPAVPTADSLVYQGVTTVIAGQCGLSPAPLLEETREEVIGTTGAHFKELADLTPWSQWTTFDEYLSFLEKLSISVNMVPLVGQGVIRAGIMGFRPGRGKPDQMRQMKRLLDEALAAGAFGISSGLIYPPGNFTDTDELIELARMAAEQGGLYFSHIRNEGEALLDAVSEAIRIGRESEAAVQISHFKAFGKANWDLSARALDMIDQAREQGLEVSADIYPYTAGSTVLASLLPDWAHQGGAARTIERLTRPETRSDMKTEMENQGFSDNRWGELLICNAPGHPEWEGKYIDRLAAESHQNGHDWIFDALLETNLDTSMILFGISEENRCREIIRPWMTIGSDGWGLIASGPLAVGKPHPRNYGAFPRVFRKYVREKKILTLEEAVQKMTGLSASKLGLTDCGYIRPGYAADLVLFDPEQIRDTADYRNPHQYAQGIMHVLVNGCTVLENGRHNGQRPGRILRHK